MIRLAGHTLSAQGAAFTLSGERVRQHANTANNRGRAHCSCGEFSPVLESNNERRSWHNDHKRAAGQ